MRLFPASLSDQTLCQNRDEISDYIQRNAPDVDGDGKMPGTDAVNRCRLLFGYRESAVLDGVVFRLVHRGATGSRYGTT